MSMIMINNENFQKEVLEGGELKLLVFGAEWCGHCKVLKPNIMKLGQANPDLKICLHNVDEATDAVEEFHISGVPCLVILKDGKEADRHVGAMSLSQLENFLGKNR